MKSPRNTIGFILGKVLNAFSSVTFLQKAGNKILLEKYFNSAKLDFLYIVSNYLHPSIYRGYPNNCSKTIHSYYCLDKHHHFSLIMVENIVFICGRFVLPPRIVIQLAKEPQNLASFAFILLPLEVKICFPKIA